MNNIHSSCIIDSSVELGNNNTIMPNTVIYGPTRIGNNNKIGPGVVIGMPGQDTRNRNYDASNSIIEIGDDNIIREFVSIQKPCYESRTFIGNRAFIMHGVHIPHDAILQDDVVVTPGCVLAGIVHVLRGANIGISSAIHQRSIIGHYSMIAMSSSVTKNIKPFTIFTPGKPPRVNRYSIEKYGFNDYFDEIKNYVLHDVNPASKILRDITDEFELLHSLSKRSLYTK